MSLKDLGYAIEPAEDLWDWRDPNRCHETRDDMANMLAESFDEFQKERKLYGMMLINSNDTRRALLEEIYEDGLKASVSLLKKYEPLMMARREADGFPQIETKSTLRKGRRHGKGPDKQVRPNQEPVPASEEMAES